MGTATEIIAVSGIVDLAAGERLAPPERKWRWHPWAWGAALVLHAVVITLLLMMRESQPPEAEQSPPGVSVVFENGGEQQTAAPPAPMRGPNSPAEEPTPPPSPPPPQPAQAQAEVNLNMPDAPLATLQSAPQPQPQRRQRTVAHPRPHTAPPQHYAMMLNGMSYGNPSPVAPAPPVSHAKHALNLSLPLTDMQSANAPEISIKGEIGADWEAALDKWVEAHKYYPQAAIEQNQQGSVQIEFNVDRAGNVTGVHLLSGSGSPFLDQAWLGLFARNHLPPFPQGTKADHITVDATMHYELIQ